MPVLRPGALRSLLSRARGNGELPFPASAALAIKYRLDPFVRFGSIQFYAWPLSPELNPPDCRFKIRELDIAEVAALAASFERPRGELHRRMRLGDRCFCAFDGARAIHMRWLATRPIELPDLDLYVCPDGDEVYFFDAQTIPEYRSQGASNATNRFVEPLLLTEGYRRAYGYRVKGNPYSRVKSSSPYRMLFEIPFVRFRGGPSHRAEISAHPIYPLDAIPTGTLLVPPAQLEAPKPRESVSQVRAH